MISIQERFARAAERLEGVPFVQHGRDPKIGLDCVGAVIVPARKVGVRFEDREYVIAPGSDFWEPMVAVIESQADPVEGAVDDPDLWRRGDILGFRFAGLRNHLGVCLGGKTMVHAESAKAIKRVVRVPVDHARERMVQGVWRLRG